MSIQLTDCTIRDNPCNECPFTAGGVPLCPETMKDIIGYLSKGQNHLCHKDETNKTVCRGGRNLQLKMFHAMGIGYCFNPCNSTQRLWPTCHSRPLSSCAQRLHEVIHDSPV